MARISTSNARLMRSGIQAGKEVVRQNRMGMRARPRLSGHKSALEYRAYMHMIQNEMDRLARKGAGLLNKLRHGDL